MSEKNKASLLEANAEISKSNIDGFLSYCTDDIRWEMVGENTLSGKEAVRQYMEKTYIEPPQFTVAQLIADGDFLVAVGDISLKDAGGKTTHYSYSDVWRFQEGKMAELRAFVVEKGAR